MAVVTTKSTLITNMETSPPIQNPTYNDGGRVRCAIATVAVANGDSIGSIYPLFRVYSHWRIVRLLLRTNAITSAAANFGLYKVDATTAVSAACYASAQSIATAITTLPVDLAFSAKVLTTTVPYQQVWADAGLTADPKLAYYLSAVLTAAATAGGNFSVEMFYTVD
jgi:hypothetical protein